MQKLSIATLAIVLAGAGLMSAPALAATSPGTVPMCTTGDAQRMLKNDTDTLRLGRDGQDIASVDVWNGCIKVIYNGSGGHSTTAFYDPDTLSLVGGRGPQQG